MRPFEHSEQGIGLKVRMGHDLLAAYFLRERARRGARQLYIQVAVDENRDVYEWCDLNNCLSNLCLPSEILPH